MSNAILDVAPGNDVITITTVRTSQRLQFMPVLLSFVPIGETLFERVSLR